MNENKSYFGFTIGPIYEVMSNSRKTRELWFGSFFFSWFVKKIYSELENLGFEFIIPFYENNNEKKSKAGLFPDHIIGSVNLSAQDFNTCFEKFINDILGDFEKMILWLLTETEIKGLSVSIKKQLRDYIQTGYIIIPDDEIKKTGNIVEDIEGYINAIEHNRFIVTGKKKNTCQRCKSLESIVKTKVREGDIEEDKNLCALCLLKLKAHTIPLILDEIGMGGLKYFRYRSIPEISAAGLLANAKSNELESYLKKNDGEIDFDDAGFHALVGGKDNVKPYHKYMAIVKADGDNLSDILKQISSDPDSIGLDAHNELSERLFDFSKNVNEITEKYKGELVYAGGDDLLSFIPLAFSEIEESCDTDTNTEKNEQNIKRKEITKTVIDYALELSDKYNFFVNRPGEKAKSSLSFGISIFYFKYPLSKALKRADEQLNYIAKKNKGKNSLALQLTQHSGQSTQLLFSFSDSPLSDFNSYLKNIISAEKEVPHGILAKLAKFKTLIINAEGEEDINNIFENVIKDDSHKKNYIFDDILNIIIGKIESAMPRKIRTTGVLTDAADETHIKPEDAFNDALSQIRFVEFIRGDQ